MVATSHPLATQIGLDVLKNGGNAIDAAIAANIALGLMEPTGNGIGGDLFVIVWDEKSQKLYGLNASGPAPEAITIDYLSFIHISEPTRLRRISYAVFCLKKKKNITPFFSPSLFTSTSVISPRHILQNETHDSHSLHY